MHKTMKTLWNYIMFSFVGITYWAAVFGVAINLPHWGLSIVWLSLMWIPYSITYDNAFKERT